MQLQRVYFTQSEVIVGGFIETTHCMALNRNLQVRNSIKSEGRVSNIKICITLFWKSFHHTSLNNTKKTIRKS